MTQFSITLKLLQCAVLLPLCMPAVSAANGDTMTEVIVIGDSTASNYTRDPRTYPQSGWAMFLQDHFSPSAADIVVVRDLAVSGRSSKSYYDEQLWQHVKSTFLSAGDYVFIQFGHNDQVPSPTLHTDPFTTYKQHLTIYINDTRAAMAMPVLLTPISRAVWQSGAFVENLGDYPVAVRQLAAELQVPLIDLNADTAALFTKLGEDATQHNLFMCLPAGKYPNYPQGINDTTHLQVQGAKQVAALAAEGIRNANLPLQKYLLNSTLV